MDIVPIAVEADSNVEYEMIQDGATSSIATNDEMQAMDYSSAHPDDEQIHEVTMEEYGQGQDPDGKLSLVEEGEIDDTATMEEEMNDEDAKGYVDEIAETDYADDALSEEQVVQGEGGYSPPKEVVQDEDKKSQQADQGEADQEDEESAGKEGEEGINDAGKNTGAEVLVEDNGKAEAEVQAEEQEGTEERRAEGQDQLVREDEEAYRTDAVEEREEEEEEEIHAPPAARVTFNGQDFVLFPHSEPSTYISAQQAEPIAAPKLSVDPSLFYESLDSLFEGFRVKDSLGDFLEEGAELEINFVDLALRLREDDVYAREVSLNDIHRLHLGFGLSSSLHLVVSEVSRFITRYNELAAHASSIFDQAAEQKEDTSHAEPDEAQNVEPERSLAEEEEDEKQEETTEAYNEDDNVEDVVEAVKAEPFGKEGENEEQLPSELYNEEDDDTIEGGANVSEALESSHSAEAVYLAEEVSISNQNHEETNGGGHAAADIETKGDDIVDYDEAYHSDEVGEAEAGADKPEYDEEENQQETYEDKVGDSIRQSKRPLEEEVTRGQDYDRETMNESEGKRVKVDA